MLADAINKEKEVKLKQYFKRRLPAQTVSLVVMTALFVMVAVLAGLVAPAAAIPIGIAGGVGIVANVAVLMVKFHSSVCGAAERAVVQLGAKCAYRRGAGPNLRKGWLELKQAIVVRELKHWCKLLEDSFIDWGHRILRLLLVQD